ncbi:MAG: hypothetical protein V1806_15960 [Pseudomonadota bacterium]
MEREGVAPIFSDDEDNGTLCFENCGRFGEGCRNCERVRQAQGSAPRMVPGA